MNIIFNGVVVSKPAPLRVMRFWRSAGGQRAAKVPYPAYIGETGRWRIPNSATSVLRGGGGDGLLRSIDLAML